ncbi:hypothetical protein MTBPR1_90023 [Candidatus Terasakiella magnetica]|uniref:Uncharacterized protein n=1 Tax=Candidatus Terasakiella magnetica TaxID=1867952 RepID=A0A1C3RLL4_9PROT|nr:hypothetical protein [Candidatus Terasakiella magnetica]SCA58176.1 hypothetical protein MTBPR1_90023 [Candidatus Terasakiella magnetica]
MHLLGLHGTANAETAPPDGRMCFTPSSLTLRFIQTNILINILMMCLPPLPCGGIFYGTSPKIGEVYG